MRRHLRDRESQDGPPLTPLHEHSLGVEFVRHRIQQQSVGPELRGQHHQRARERGMRDAPLLRPRAVCDADQDRGGIRFGHPRAVVV
jgi:hypothetical protein